MSVIHILPGEWDTALKHIKQAKRLTKDLNRRATGQPPISNVDVYAACQRARWCCAECQQTENLLIGYHKPLSAGGRHDADNIRLMCQDCWAIQQIAAIWRKWTPVHRIQRPTRYRSSQPAPVYLVTPTVALLPARLERAG